MTEDFNISGKWMNRMTGDVVTVRNTIIDGDDMIIICADGRQMKMTEFQNYIQMSDDDKSGDDTMSLGNIRNLESERRVVVGRNNVQNNTPQNNTAFYDDIEEVIERPKNSVVQKPKAKEISESEKLLNKLFEKIELNIDVHVDLKCDNFPVKELNMLQMIYDVTIDDISSYIIKNVINDEVFRSAVSSYIKERLE